ncbi:dephospho-CoA kinase domain-containing protein [Biomphalaria glabrata]
MFLVGLTGGIASGKSTVTKIFREELGCACIDADAIARQVVEPGTSANKTIRVAFGEDICFPDGTLNREKLGDIIFHDESKRYKLNSIVHPAVKKQMLWEIFLYFLKGYHFVILDIPLLFETRQLLPFLTFSIVVFCSENQQVKRLMERNQLSEADAMARIKSQLPLDEKCQMGSFTIDNTGTIEETRSYTLNIYKTLCSSKRHLSLRFGIVAVVSLLLGTFFLLSQN